MTEKRVWTEKLCTKDMESFDGCTLDSFVTVFSELPKQFPLHFNFLVRVSCPHSWDYDEDRTYLFIYGDRYETDEEQLKRIEAAERAKITTKERKKREAKEREEKQYQEFLRLKKKFDKEAKS